MLSSKVPKIPGCYLQLHFRGGGQGVNLIIAIRQCITHWFNFNYSISLDLKSSKSLSGFIMVYSLYHLYIIYSLCNIFLSSISLDLESSSLSGSSMVYELTLGSLDNLAAERTQMLEYLLATGIIIKQGYLGIRHWTIKE